MNTTPDNSHSRTTMVRRTIYVAKRVIQVAILTYLGLIVVLAVNEPNLVYPGSKYPHGNWQPDSFQFEEVSFESAGGVRLVGWYLPLADATETVLVCHGNAENISQSTVHTGLKFQSVCNANVFVFDYRGYGKSEGSPAEKGILEDTEAAMKWLTARTGTRPGDVIIVGHSIGGGPAVHVAVKMGAKAMFLQRTFASLVELAQEKYWFVPVSWIMKNRYPSAEKIRNCHVPLHQSHGDRDHLVPIESGRKLFSASPAEIKTFIVNRNQGHWDDLPFEYWRSVEQFMDRINR